MALKSHGSSKSQKNLEMWLRFVLKIYITMTFLFFSKIKLKMNNTKKKKKYYNQNINKQQMILKKDIVLCYCFF